MPNLKLENLDKLNVRKSLELFPDQLQEAWEQVNQVELPKITSSCAVLCGMGGSGLAGRIIAGLSEESLPMPIFIHNDYGLPGWVGKDTLVVLNSYSGNTEETISSLEAAKKARASVLGLTTGGKLAQLITSGETAGVVLSPTTNPAGFPKTGLGASLGGLLALLGKSGVIPLKEEEFKRGVEDLGRIRENWLSDTDDNLAKKFASWFAGNIPVLIGSRPLLGALHAGRNLINELGRTFALFFDLPEADHHLVEATEFPKVTKSKIRYLFFESGFSHPRVKVRFKLTEELFAEQGLSLERLKLTGAQALTQALELSHLCAWIAFYLSQENRVDPGPEPWIIKLKEKLAHA